MKRISGLKSGLIVIGIMVVIVLSLFALNFYVK